MLDCRLLFWVFATWALLCWLLMQQALVHHYHCEALFGCSLKFVFNSLLSFSSIAVYSRLGLLLPALALCHLGSPLLLHSLLGSQAHRSNKSNFTHCSMPCFLTTKHLLARSKPGMLMLAVGEVRPEGTPFVADFLQLLGTMV